MENSIPNIAIISFPRTASKSLAEWYGKQFNKPVALGSLHYPTHLGSNKYNVRRIVFAESHILHGHWHSLCKLDDDVLQYLKANYKIVTSYREMKLVYDSFIRITNSEELFYETINQSNKEKNKWKIWKHHILNGDNIETIQSTPKGFC